MEKEISGWIDMEDIISSVQSLSKTADVFLDDKVIARNFVDAEGKNCSLGYVLPGEFDVTVEDSETVEVLGGSFRIQLPGEEEYSEFKRGESFYIPKGASYHLVVDDYFDYCVIFGL